MAEEKKEKDLAKEIQKEESKIVKELKKNPWIAATFVFAIIALILLFFAFKGGKVVSQDEVGASAVSFINTQLLQGQGTVTLANVSEKAGLYEVNVLYNGQTVPAYFTKDGGYYVGTMILPLVAADDSGVDTTTPVVPKEVVKSDKPKVELFVMTHCPYGTQAEKGILPALATLGNSVDYDIKFVHYFMHGAKEENETYRQLCIQEKQGMGLYNSYLKCFLNSTSGSDEEAKACMTKVGVNSAVVNSCIAGDEDEGYYAVDSAASEGYGVQGSPTLVINGVEVDFYPRSPESALSVICSAFNVEPAVCSAVLSSANPSAGFGYAASEAGDAAADASCG